MRRVYCAVSEPRSLNKRLHLERVADARKKKEWWRRKNGLHQFSRAAEKIVRYEDRRK